MNLKFSQNFSLLLYSAILLTVKIPAVAQAGQLDPSFGSGGIAEVQNAVSQKTNFYTVGAVVIQSDGKIVVAGAVPGSNDFTVPAVFRFLSSGTLDQSFGTNGVAVRSGDIGGYGSAAIQSDGKILVATNASSSDGEVDRFSTTGQLDSSFGKNGAVTFGLTSLSGLALQPDGEILVSLQTLLNPKSAVARLMTNGNVDKSFGTNGVAFPPGGVGNLEVLSNGEILVFGGLISRLTSAGASDPAFGVSGQLIAPNGGHAVAASGDIIAAGALVSDPTIPSAGLAAFAYQSVGIGDPTFGTNGGLSTPFTNFPAIAAAGIGLESTGAIVELGTVSSKTQTAFGLVRYTAQGQVDTSFGSGGTVTTSFGAGSTPAASAIAIQSDDKIVAVGTVVTNGDHGQFNTSLVVARYLGD